MSHGIEGQRHETFQRQIGGELLRLRFPLLRMAGLQKHGGIATRLVGPVKVGGYIEARQTLENYFLDGVVLSLDTTRNSGIQRAIVVGQTADQRQ